MSKKEKNKEEAELLKEIAKDLFELMGLTVEFEVNEDKKNDALFLKINTEEEAGLIIGNRGRTLNSIQVILGIIYKGRVGEWKRIVVDISNWREKEEERLVNLADLTAQRAKETGEAQFLYNLTPAQRRVVHLALSENSEIVTESQGEGKDRYLIVTPKS